MAGWFGYGYKLGLHRSPTSLPLVVLWPYLCACDAHLGLCFLCIGSDPLQHRHRLQEPRQLVWRWRLIVGAPSLSLRRLLHKVHLPFRGHGRGHRLALQKKILRASGDSAHWYHDSWSLESAKKMSRGREGWILDSGNWGPSSGAGERCRQNLDSILDSGFWILGGRVRYPDRGWSPVVGFWNYGFWKLGRSRGRSLVGRGCGREGRRILDSRFWKLGGRTAIYNPPVVVGLCACVRVSRCSYMYIKTRHPVTRRACTSCLPNSPGWTLGLRRRRHTHSSFLPRQLPLVAVAALAVGKALVLHV